MSVENQEKVPGDGESQTPISNAIQSRVDKDVEILETLSGSANVNPSGAMGTSEEVNYEKSVVTGSPSSIGGTTKQSNSPTLFYEMGEMPTVAPNRNIDNYLERASKKLKRMNKKSVKKTFRKFLGSKEKFNMKEILKDVQNGLRPNQSEWDLCSLRQIVDHPPITGRAILPLTPQQLSGFKLHPNTNLDVRPQTTPGEFKVPVLPLKKKRKGRGKSTVK